ncbi:probable palmitoyltransferase ZDHHC24 [Galleria mellonella]|uniref:Palmitoyltransferase n=1 Tax=Galleria mellonella TaxID=7137 RepID=A0A6J3CAH6_GALME|nr:probable palmitoyltransferase ZDHHC24 [Galleria mellonella]
MTIVRSNLVRMFDIGIVKHALHIILSTFCFINVIGNMIMTIVTDNSSKGDLKNGIFCEVCKRDRSPSTWHCRSCNICILKRDHHCFFFSSCIGLHNRRYYLLFLIYIVISLVYSSYYNYFYISSKFENYAFIISFFRIINPLLRFLIPEPMSNRDLYVFFLFLNVCLLGWMLALFCFHINNAIKGITTHESKDIRSKNYEWKENIINVFGKR